MNEGTVEHPELPAKEAESTFRLFQIVTKRLDTPNENDTDSQNHTRTHLLAQKEMTLILTALLLLVATSASANGRNFTYAYQTGVLPVNEREIEVWTTARLGRDNYYARFDHKLEFEVGVTENLQTAFYLNFGAITAETEPGVNASVFRYSGVANEWKLRLSDPVADAFGFALYGEVGAATDELKFEAKLLFDKRIGNVLLAANLIGEHKMGLGQDGEDELELSVVVGAAYFVSRNFSLGIEARNQSALPEYEDLEYSALWIGPTVAYAAKGWWMAFSVLPQLPALSKEGVGSGTDLDHNEAVSARLLFSFEI